MRIAFNPSTVTALITPPNNKDITFDLRGHNIFARGVKFCGTDTNTWRDIKINNVSIGSNTLNLRDGSNTTLTNTNGVVTINSTWRPVVDNLTSDSTTSSLSANQGRILKALIDGKSDSEHTHDDRYVKKTGDTMRGALNFANNTWNKMGDDVYMGDHNIGGQLCIMGANDTTGLCFHKHGDTSIRKSITFDGNTLYMNGSCNYATLSNQTNLLAINTVPNKTAATSIGSWSPISGRYVFHQKWTDTSTGSDSADFGIYLDGNLTANMVLDGYYNSLLGFRVIGATGGFLKANGTIDNSTYLTSHQSLSNYYTKGEVDNQLSKYKLKSSIWVPEAKIICSNFRDFLNKENLHKQAPEELNLYRFFAAGDESNYSSKYNYPVVDSHAMVFSIDGNNGYIRSMNFDLRSNDVYVTSRVANGEWRSWVRLLNTSDVAGLKNDLTVHQYLSNTDTTWWPLIWGGSSHNNTSNSTGTVYKSYDKLSWQTSSQTLYATNIQTNNIKNLSVGGGIYWNPYVESTTDNSDSASITVVKSGVAGGTTLVLSQMNDADDTIQFKTNGSARLYHNSYPILTTQNTYVSNNKGYINGTEITQVNNADKVDNRHAISTTPNTGIIYKAAIYTSSSLTSYWVRLASIPSISQNAEFVATIHIQSGHSNPGRSAILLVYLRGNASSFMSKSFKICCNSNYDPNRFRLYYKDSDKTSEIWYQTTGQRDGIITTVISQSSEGSLYEGLTLYSGSITAVQTPSVSTYLSAQVSTITDNISGNASTATKLQTPRTIWGQSFDGTANVNGTIYINNSDSSNGAIRLNNNVNSNARISAISDQVIFNTGNAIRFGETAWDWKQWAGLKYTHSNKTIYLGIADGSVFNSNSTQSGGILNLRAGISNIDLNSGTSIRGLATNGAPYSSRITLNDTSIFMEAYGNISMSTGPGAIELKAGQGAKASIGSDFKIESSRGVYLNSGNSGNVWLCQGGGNVSIGYSSPSYKLDVNGQMRASGFHHSSMDSNNYILLAGGGYKPYGGNYENPIFLGYLNLERGNDGTISSSFYCLGYSVSFTYTRGGNYCKIYIPDTSYQVFYIRAAIASVNYSGGGMDTWHGLHRSDGAWWLHCYAYSSNEVRVKGFRQANDNNDSWWGGNPLIPDNGGANRITVCIFGYVTFR